MSGRHSIAAALLLCLTPFVAGQAPPAPADAAFASYQAHLAAAHASIRLDDTFAARRWLDAAPAPLRGWEWRFLDAVLDESDATLEAGQKTVLWISVSPDGQLVATSGADGTIRLWERVTWREVRTLRGHESAAYCVKFSPDGRRLASASLDTTCRIWDAATGECTLVFKGHKYPLGAITFSADGTQAASASYDRLDKPPYVEGRVLIWDVQGSQAGEIRATLTAGIKPLSAIEFSSDGKKLMTASWDGVLYLWDDVTARGKPAELWLPKEEIYNAVNAACFSPDGRWLAAGSKDHTVRVFDVQSKEVVASLRGHGGWVMTVAFDPAGKQLASGSYDDGIRLWSTESWKEVGRLRGHRGNVRSLAWLPDGHTLLSGAVDGTLRTWDTANRHYADVQLAHEQPCWGLALGPDGAAAYTGRHDGVIQVWSLQTRQPTSEWTAHQGNTCNSLAISADGKRLVSCSWDKSVKVWDADSHKRLAMKKLPAGPFAASISPDGRAVAVAQQNDVWLWDPESDAHRVLSSHENQVFGLAFSPDGRRLATSGRDKTVRVWDTATAQLLATLRGHEGDVNGVAFTRDGAQIVSAGSEGTVRLWDATSGELALELYRGDEELRCVRISPDGSRAIAGGTYLVICDLTHGGAALILRPSAEPFYMVEPTGDGSRIVGIASKFTHVLDARPRRARVEQGPAISAARQVPR